MTQNENLQRSESNEVILINTAKETQAVSSMTLTPEPLSPKTPLRVNELACLICDEVATGNILPVAVISLSMHIFTRVSNLQLYQFKS